MKSNFFAAALILASINVYAQSVNDHAYINYMTDPTHYKEKGKGELVAEARALPPGLQELVVGNGIQLNFTAAPATFFEVRAQANLLPLVQTELSGAKLIIKLSASLETDKGILVNIPIGGIHTITAKEGAYLQLSPDLNLKTLHLMMESGSEGVCEGQLENLDCVVMGGSNLKLAGAAGQTALVVKGGSTLSGVSFNTQNGDITVLGASECAIGVKGTLSARVENESTLLYYGTPRILNQETKLNGKIKKKNS